MKRTVANERTASALLGALILTSTLAGCASENRLFSKSDGAPNAWRHGRGEYAVVDRSTAQDWNAAARTGRFASSTDDVSAPNAELSAGSVAGSGASSVRGERVSVRKPVVDEIQIVRGQSRPSSDELPELPPPPKRFSERMKGFFSWSKSDASNDVETDFVDESNDESNVDSDASSRKASRKTTNRSASDATMETPTDRSLDRASRAAESAPISSNSAKNRSGVASGKYGEIRKPVAPSWTNGWNNLTGGLTKSRRAASRPVDPVLQFDESRFLPNSATFQKYYSPLEPVEASGFASSGAGANPAATSEAFASSQALAKAPIPRVSGRELAYRSQANLNRTGDPSANVETESFARSGFAQKTDADSLRSTRRGANRSNDAILSGESAFGWNDGAARLVFAVPLVVRSNVRPTISTENAGKSAQKNVEKAIGSDETKIADFFSNASETAPTTASSVLANVASETPTVPKEAASTEFAAQLGEKSFDWFDSAEPAPSAISTDLSSVSDLLTVGETTEIAETVATDFEAAAPISNDFLSSNGDDERTSEMVDDGFLSASSADFPVPDVLQDAASAKETEPKAEPGSVASVESAKLVAANVEALPTAVAPVGFENVPSSVDQRKKANDAKPPTDEEIAWVEQIKSAIRTLMQKRDSKKARGEDVRADDARLRLLYLAVGEYERSIQEIQDENDPLKAFWEKECRGLETLLQNRVEEIDPALVAERLRSGLDSLSGLCDLQIRKAVLATAPACFGLFEERKTPYFSGETLYAYSELDFVSSVETENGFEIEVECRWRLVDSEGNARTPFETQHCSNISETKLRDVVLNVAVPIPNDLEPGVYSLEMEVVDRQVENSTPAIRRLLLNVAKK